MLPATSTRLSLRFAQRSVVVLVCLSLGLHWALLQGVAWTGMFISFAREGAMIEAVEKTFDGRHACALCKKVKEGREADPAQPQQGGQEQGKPAKLDAVLVQVPRLMAPAGAPMIFAASRDVWVQRNELPETPPPRRAQA